MRYAVIVRFCDGCEAEFEGRADARFCSNACRQSDYRQRRAERRALEDHWEARYGTRDAVAAFERMVAEGLPALSVTAAEGTICNGSEGGR